MRATIVPAQVTTIEDRVAGRLSFMQLTLFAIPVFGGSLLYAILPPSMESATYKLVVICSIAIVGLSLAIRIKGKIVLLWLVILMRYYGRPGRYIFSKNTLVYRERYDTVDNLADRIDAASTINTKSTGSHPALLSHERALAQAALEGPSTRVHFVATRKGGLYVHVSKEKE